MSGELDFYDRYEIDGGTFETQYNGRCALDSDHKIRRGERVARVIRKDNPMLPVGGVICKRCIGELR